MKVDWGGEPDQLGTTGRTRAVLCSAWLREGADIAWPMAIPPVETVRSTRPTPTFLHHGLAGGRPLQKQPAVLSAANGSRSVWGIFATRHRRQVRDLPWFAQHAVADQKCGGDVLGLL